MKYALLFCGTLAEDEAWWSMPEAARQEAYQRAGEWFQTNGSKLEGGFQLQPASTATTIRKNGAGEPVVTDGPFAESGEVIGGFTIMNADNLDEVLAVTKSWPGGSVEIRPVVER